MKKNRYIISLALAGFAFSFCLQGYAANLPIVEILGKKFYLYETRKGDTLFGIARENKWNDAELQRLNPGAVSPLKKGIKIYYPVTEGEASTVSAESIKSAPQTELTHIINKGETVYSISQLYGIPVDTIYKLNPGSRNGIRADETLILKNPSAKASKKGKGNASSFFYTVKNGDTLYSVANANGVSVAALMKTNPGVSESNFKAGETIKIPARGSGIEMITRTVEEPRLEGFTTHEVKSDETWKSIAAKNNIDIQLLKDANPGVAKLKKKQTLTIPKVENVAVDRTVVNQDPRELSPEGVNEIYNDIHKVADSKERIVRLAIVAESPNARKDVEFIRGFLTGINELKRKSYKIELKVVDGTQPSESVITELDDFKPTLVFLTADKSIPGYIGEYASVSQTPVVNTFDIKSEEYTTNPYFIQLLTPSNYFNDNVASNAFEKYGDYKLLFVGSEDRNDLLASSLKKYWNPRNVKSLPSGSLEAVDPSQGKYLVYGYSTKKDEVDEILKDVVQFKEQSPLSDVVVLGRPNWIVYDESLASELHKANTVIPSRFYINEDSAKARHFTAEYKSLFNRTPVKSLPLYAGVGYDASMYFIQALAEASLDINSLTSSSNTLQSEFDLQRVSNWGGFINPPVYFVHFTPFDTIDKIVIE